MEQKIVKFNEAEMTKLSLVTILEKGEFDLANLLIILKTTYLIL